MLPAICTLACLMISAFTVYEWYQTRRNNDEYDREKAKNKIIKMVLYTVTGVIAIAIVVFVAVYCLW